MKEYELILMGEDNNFANFSLTSQAAVEQNGSP